MNQNEWRKQRSAIKSTMQVLVKKAINKTREDKN